MATRRAIGVVDLHKAQAGEDLTPQRAIEAKCAECMAEHADGKFDCEMPKCPLYKWMPYKGEHEVLVDD